MVYDCIYAYVSDMLMLFGQKRDRKIMGKAGLRWNAGWPVYVNDMLMHAGWSVYVNDMLMHAGRPVYVNDMLLHSGWPLFLTIFFLS